MKKNTSKVVVLLLAFSMLFATVGCSSKEKVEEATNETVETETGDWTHENRGIVTNLNSAASTSDPFAHANVNDRGWLLNAYEPLFCYNGLTNENEPRVGKNFEISEDGLTYSIEIFDNVYFQNGKHCTAEDIKSSYEYAQTSSYNTQFSGIVDRVEVIDDYKVDIILKEASSPFLSNSDQIFIVDVDEIAEQGDKFGTIPNTAGTGAYYIEKYDPAVEIKLVRQDKFHREIEGRPIPEITFKVMTDSAATLIAFESGDLDFISSMPASNFAGLEASGKYNTKLGQTTQLVYMVMNNHNGGPLADQRVRQAIAYASDYEGMLNIGMEGNGNVSGKLAYAPYTIAAPAEDSGIIYKHNIEKAKELLADAGYTDGFDLGKIACIAGSSHEKMAQVLQENLSNIGITSELDSMEQVTTIAEMRKGNVSFGIMGYYMMMDYDYITGIIDVNENEMAIIKLLGSEDIEYEKIYDLFNEARTHTDEDVRRELYTEMEEILMESAVFIPILHTALPYAWDKGLAINTEKPYTYHYSQFWDAYWN